MAQWQRAALVHGIVDRRVTLGHFADRQVYVLAPVAPRRSFRPNPTPDREITSSRACPLIGPAFSPSAPPPRGMGPTAGDAAPGVGFAATPAEGAPPLGVSRAVDWPLAPCTSVAVLLSVSRGAVCGHRACVSASAANLSCGNTSSVTSTCHALSFQMS